MDIESYPPPTDTLLTYGKPPFDWPNYLELGFEPEHIPDLIRLATDRELNLAEIEEDNPEAWAPIHAWRTLGQLRAEAAIEPLLTLFEFTKARDLEWELEELPDVYSMIGPVAVPTLQRYLADTERNIWGRITVCDCLHKIGTLYPENRNECIAILSRQLELFNENDYELNAFLINNLVKMKALEAASQIEQAYAANRVDTSILGDWDDVQVLLGLKTAEEVKEKREAALAADANASEPSGAREMRGVPFNPAAPASPAAVAPRKHTDSHKKAKQKMAKASRKKNKRRK